MLWTYLEQDSAVASMKPSKHCGKEAHIDVASAAGRTVLKEIGAVLAGLPTADTTDRGGNGWTRKSGRRVREGCYLSTVLSSPEGLPSFRPQCQCTCLSSTPCVCQ